MPFGEPEEALVIHARDALSAAERLQDSGRITLSCSGVTHILAILGRAVEGLPYGHRAVEVATIVNEKHSTVRAHMVLGVTHWVLGHYWQAMGASREESRVDEE